MVRIGYYELVLYAKNIGTDSKWDSEPSLSSNNVLDIIQDIGKTAPQMHRLSRMKKMFRLNDAEAYFIFLTLLQELDIKFKKIFRNYTNRQAGLTLSLAYDIYQKNHHEIVNVRQGMLAEFFFEELGDVMILKSHVQDYIKNILEDIECMTQNTNDIVRDYYFDRLKNMPGGFYFRGPAGIGRKSSFLRLANYKKQLPVFIIDERYLEKKLFDAVVHEKAICVVEDSLYSAVKRYTPYMEFWVLIGEKNYSSEELFEVTFSHLDFEQRHYVWEQKLKGYSNEVDLRRLANQYVLTPKEIEEIVQYSERLRVFECADTIHMDMVSRAVHKKLAEKSSNLNPAKQTSYSLEDVVLPEKQKQKIAEALGQVFMKHRVMEEYGLKSMLSYGRGLSMMFVGPPGTGKTMSAFACANELDSILYKVDLSSVVSKFVGETEKNLKKIFDEAKLTQSILFFDEADVLFSKRTEVKDSSDKYSNMEAAFLLQEMENYDGVTLLATNFIQNIDEAFKRRIKFIIEFPFPDKKERLEIFKRAIPPRLPLASDIDFEFIANQFELSGGNIKNIIYNAACLGANEDQPIGMKHLVRAIVLEYEKMGKALSKADFDIYQNLVQ